MKTAVLILYIASAIMNGITADRYLIVSRRLVEARVASSPPESKISPAGLATGSPVASGSSAPEKSTQQRREEFVSSKSSPDSPSQGAGSRRNSKAMQSIIDIYQKLTSTSTSKILPANTIPSGPIQYTIATRTEDGPIGEAETYERPDLIVLRLKIGDDVVKHYDKMFTDMQKDGDLVAIHSIERTQEYSLNYIGHLQKEPSQKEKEEQKERDYFFGFEIVTTAILPNPVEFNK